MQDFFQAKKKSPFFQLGKHIPYISYSKKEFSCTLRIYPLKRLVVVQFRLCWLSELSYCSEEFLVVLQFGLFGLPELPKKNNLTYAAEKACSFVVFDCLGCLSCHQNFYLCHKLQLQFGSLSSSGCRVAQKNLYATEKACSCAVSTVLVG